MSKYMMYLLRGKGKFYVGKVKLEQARRELNLHRNGKYQDTQNWLLEQKDEVNIFWLEVYEGSRKEAFGQEITWTRYFLNKGWEHSNENSNVISYARSLEKRLDLNTPDGFLLERNQNELKRIVEENVKKYKMTNVSVFMNEDEHQQIKELARDAELTMSQYLKQKGIYGKVEVHDYTDLVELSSKISSMDQSLRHLVYNDYPNKELVRNEIRELTKAQDMLIREIRNMYRRSKRGKN